MGDVRRVRFGVSGVACAALGCAATPAAPSPLRPVSAAPLSAACEFADVERRAALERLQAGQWFAALRRLQLAEASCPERALQSATQVKSTTEKLAAGLGGSVAAARAWARSTPGRQARRANARCSSNGQV